MAGCAYYAVVFNKTKVVLLIIILRWKVPPQKTINGNRNFKRSFSFPFVDKRSLFLTKLFFKELNLVFCKVERLACFWDNQGTQGGLLSIFKWRGWSNWGKNPWDFQQNPLKNPLTNLRALKITDSIKWYNTKNFSKSLDVRYCRTTYAQKNPFSNQGSKKCMETFSSQKIPKLQNRKFQTPKKSFDHPRHLKSGVPSGPRQLSIWRNLRYILYKMVKESTFLEENVCIIKFS